IQFDGGDVEIRRNSYVEDMDDVEDVIKVAKKDCSIIAYTIVVPSLKDYLDKRAQDEQILAVDLLEPLINVFKTRFNKEPHHRDRKSTRLNSSHVSSSYAVFCLKKKTKRKCTLVEQPA